MLNQFQKPNLNAPRYTPETFNPLTKEFFRTLRKTNPELNVYSDTQIRKIIKTSNIQMYKDILEFRDGLEFPESLGYGFIGSCPKKIEVNVDYKVSADHDKVIQHRNWESDDYLAKIFYTNHEAKYRFKFHDMWTFEGSRNFTRDVGQMYPKNWKKYIQVDHSMKVARLFRKEKMNTVHKKKTEILLETYNEFEGF